MPKIIHVKNEEQLNEHINIEELTDFLHKHLGQFGDTKSAIKKSIDYALEKDCGKGGFILLGYENDELVGALIMNKTGMSEYIPENILVYVAVHENHRGKGIGGQIIEKSFELADGDIKLHVEYENPAKRLYERLGMNSKYAEMRYSKD